MRALLLLGLAFLGVPPAATSGFVGSASELQGPQQIAFVRDWRLYLMDADGRNQRRVRGFVVSGFPSWSPDGRRFAFATRGPKSRIWIAKPNGTEPRPAIPAGFHDCLWFVWSPNSKRLAYTRNDGCEGWLYVLTVDATGARRKLLSRGARSLDPAWSPTGRTIVYTSAPTNNSERLGLYLRNPEGGASRRIPRTRAIISNSGLPSRPTAVWARNGRSILFLGMNADGGVGLFRVTMNGRVSHDLAAGLPAVTSFDISRRGRVVLGVREAGSGQIYSMKTDGTDRHRLTEVGVLHGTDPRWSPDGRKIIFVGRAQGVRNTDIYVMNADGSGKQNLTRSAGDDEAPTWSVVR